ncbi:MAG TPA: hypothetical protein VNH41_12280 [Steroidobacteraceae bacterium]|nr:hypothetical protein [Steroidobacteraceae bacterium]
MKRIFCWFFGHRAPKRWHFNATVPVSYLAQSWCERCGAPIVEEGQAHLIRRPKLRRVK